MRYEIIMLLSWLVQEGYIKCGVGAAKRGAVK